MHQKQEAVSVREPIQIHEIHQYDARERIVGGDEQTEGTRQQAHPLVAREERNEKHGDAAKAHAGRINEVRVEFFAVARPTKSNLAEHVDDADEGDEHWGVSLGHIVLDGPVGQINVDHVVPRVEDEVWDGEEKEAPVEEVTKIEDVSAQPLEVAHHLVDSRRSIGGDGGHRVAVDVGARAGFKAVTVDVEHGAAISQRMSVNSQVLENVHDMVVVPVRMLAQPLVRHVGFRLADLNCVTMLPVLFPKRIFDCRRGENRRWFAGRHELAAGAETARVQEMGVVVENHVMEVSVFGKLLKHSDRNLKKICKFLVGNSIEQSLPYFFPTFNESR